jgi:hypothetical protein
MEFPLMSRWPYECSLGYSEWDGRDAQDALQDSKRNSIAARAHYGFTREWNYRGSKNMLTRKGDSAKETAVKN